MLEWFWLTQSLKGVLHRVRDELKNLVYLRTVAFVPPA